MAQSETYPLFREAEVVSTNDPEDLGRIQLRVFPELSETPEADLPWAFPLASGPHDGDFGTPLEKQWIYCVVWNKYWSEISFTPWTLPDPKNPRFRKLKEKLIPKIKEYKGKPDIRHCVGSVLEDEFAEFHDTKESQHGILHPSGSYVFMDKNGELFVNSVKRITFHNDDGSVSAVIDSESGNVDLKTKGSVKKDVKGNAEEKISGAWKINVTGAAEIKANGAAKIVSSSVTTVKASSSVTVDAPVLEFKGNKTKGSVPPTGTGIGCSIGQCPVCKLPHKG